MGKMFSQKFYSILTSLIVYYLMIPSQSSIAHENHNARGASDLLDLIKIEFGKQNHRIALLENQNRNHDNDIDLLKVDNFKIHDEIDLINENLFNEVFSNNDAEPSNSNDDNASDAPLQKQYQKRVSRLIPLNLRSNSEKEVMPTVPFNCSDLNKMGQTVNGIYLVKGGNTDRNSQINVVLCDFQLPVAEKDSLSTVEEKRLGFVELNSVSKWTAPEGIYFYVQRGNGPTNKDGVIRFHTERLNIGKGMNITTGIFTAPKAGVYQFSFAISKEGFSFPALHIYLRVNKVKIGLAIVSPGLVTAPATFQSTIQLKKGDRVDVWKPNSGTLCECKVIGEIKAAIEPPCHHFTGWLLKEDLN